MVKTLKQILDGVKSSKIKDKNITGSNPGVDYRPKAGDEQKFADKHKIEKHADRAGNGDDVYNATNVKSYMDDGEPKHGYKAGSDAKVYEAKDCNNSPAGKSCGVHGLKKCPGTSVKESNEELTEFLVQNYVSGSKNKRAEVHKVGENFTVKKFDKAQGGNLVASSTHDDSGAAHTVAKKHITESEDLNEMRVVDAKSVMNSRGKLDRYELRHYGTGKGWHSIVKTHQDDEDLYQKHGNHNVIHVGGEGYVKKKWNTIKHQKPIHVYDPDQPPAVTKIRESTELDEKAAIKPKENDKDTVLVTVRNSSEAKRGGGVKRIKKSDYNPKIHDLAEREMTSSEMDKREEIVKSMKKKLSDFRARYGSRAKDVMYATATKKAMKEEVDITEQFKSLVDRTNALVSKLAEHEDTEWLEEKFNELDTLVSSIEETLNKKKKENSVE